MDAATCRALLALGTRRQYAPGERLMVQGDDSDDVIVLLEGLVKVTAVTERGDEALLAVRSGGDVVGELAGLGGQPRSATVTAAGVVVGQRLSRAEFDIFQRRYPPAADALNKALAAKLTSTLSGRTTYNDPVLVRLAQVLLELAHRHGRPVPDGTMIDFPLTQPELASLARAAEPTVHKALRLLRERGTVTTGYRRIIVRDLDALRRVMNEDYDSDPDNPVV